MPPARRLSSDADVDALVAIYGRARRRTEALMKAAIARGATGTAAYHRQQLGAIRRELRLLERATPGLLASAIRKSYLDGATIVDALISPTSPMKVGAQGQFFGTHEPAVAAIAGRLDSRLALARQTIGRQADDVFARLGRQEVSTGIAAGLTRRQVSRALEDELLAEGMTAFVDRRGARWQLDTYAETVARTTTREAVTIGTVNRVLELGRDLVTVSQHANACSICRPFEGRTYSITGQSEGYPRAERLPPFHPRCRHVTTPAEIFSEPEPEPVELPPEVLEDPGEIADELGPDPAEAMPQASDHFELSGNRELQAEARDQLAAIESVHAYPEGLPTIPLQIKRISDSTYGRLRTSWSALSMQALEQRIELNRRYMAQGDDATVHEAGHFLDFYGAQAAAADVKAELVSTRPVRSTWPSAEAEETAAWRRAVRSTEVGRRAIAEGGAYLGSWHEIWARSYEQWIALRSRNGRLLEKIGRRRAEDLDQRVERYWDDRDFEPIAAAFDEIFATRGLLKRRGGRRESG